MKPQALLTRRVPAAVFDRLSDVCDVDLFEGTGAIPRPELIRRVAGKDALVCLLTDRIDREVLEAGTNLRIVANIAVGYDNVDVRQAASRGIVVTNTPNVLTEATAELTWALILAAARRVTEGDRVVRAGKWRGWALDYMLGMELRGKQLGLVGLGRIGAAVASRAPAFGMTVAAFAPPGRARKRRSAQPVPDVALMPLEDLLRTSDVVSLHVPLTPETKHLIDRKALTRMKRSAYLVNTSRGPVVDEGALAWALGQRLIAGAALDVYEREPEVHPGLLGLEHVVLAPHLGSATTETRTAMADLAVSNVLAVLDGKPPMTAVSA